MKKLITLTVLGTAAVAAHASDWQTILQNSSDTITIERTTIKRHGTHALVWMRDNYSQTQTDHNLTYNGLTRRFDFDCAKDTMEPQAMIWTRDGVQIKAMNLSSESYPVAPDTVASTVEHAVCGPVAN